MALCGYNDKMSDGIRTFLEGLAEYGIIHRSKIKNRSIDESLAIELSDLDRLLSEVDNLEDPEKKDLTEGVAKLARGFYSLLKEKDIADYKTIAGVVDRFYWKMDQKYYPELEKKKEAGNPNDMKMLVQYLSAVSLKE